MSKKQLQVLSVADERGFGMVEIMVSAVILCVIALGAATLVPAAFRSNDESRDMTAATQVVNYVLETMNNLDFKDITPYPFTTEPIYTTANPQALINTTTLNASNPVTLCLERSGSSCVTGKTMNFPYKMTINKETYRVDLVVYKGKPVYLASLPDVLAERFSLASLPELMLREIGLPLSDLLVPPAQAAAALSCSGTVPSSVAIGANATFSGTVTGSGSNGYNLQWVFGPSPGTVMPGSPITFSWSTPNTYQVELRAVKGNNSMNCAGSPYSVVVYNPAIDFDVQPGLTNFISVPFNFSVTSAQCPLCTASNTVWDFGAPNPQNATGLTASRAYATAGNYDVRLTAQTPYGNFVKIKTVTVGASTVQMTAPTSSTAAVGSAVSFAATCSNCPGAIFEWDFGDSTPLEYGQTVSHTYTQVSSPTVVVNVRSGSNGPIIGSATKVLSITDNKDVFLTITPPSGVAGAPSDPSVTEFTYQVSSTGFSGSPHNPNNDPVSYELWFGDDHGPDTTPDTVLLDSSPADNTYPSALHKYLTCGIYTVKVRAVVGTVSSVKTIPLTVGAKAFISTASNQVQANTAVSFSGSSQGAGTSPSYSWLFSDDSSTATGANVTHVFTTPGTYSVQLTTAGNCNASSTIQITVLPDSNSLAANQSYMKKIFIKVAPWSLTPPASRDYIGSAVFLKADNDI